jgi:hypothetical protein
MQRLLLRKHNMKKLFIAAAVLLLATPALSAVVQRSATSFPTATPASNDYWIFTDTSNSGLFSRVATSGVRAALGLGTTSSVVFGDVSAAGAGGLKAGAEGTVRGAITIYSNVNSYAVGINSAATPTGTYTITLPAGAPGGSNYLWNMDADGTSDWTDPATFLTPTGAGGSLTVTATGFDGNLATTDNTIQEIAQKFDDFAAAGTGDMVLATAQTVTGKKTFENSDLALLGSSTGATTFASANAGATNYTLTFPAATSTIATTADIAALPEITIQTDNLTTGANNVAGSDYALQFDADGDGVLTDESWYFMPATADGKALGSATLEISDIYLAAGAVIYGENDQTNNLTSSVTGWATSLDLTITGSDLILGAAGVQFTGDGDGAVTLLGRGDGSDENMTINLDDTANIIGVSSSTGVTAMRLDMGLQANLVFNSYTSAQTLTYAAHNSSIVQMTTADEVTLWDCETAGVGAFVMLWARDAEKIEVVPASGDHFNLFAGTALTADYELDMAATAGTKITLMCTADDTWSVYSETAASVTGGAAD